MSLTTELQLRLSLLALEAGAIVGGQEGEDLAHNLEQIAQLLNQLEQLKPPTSEK
jgi:hypothetical protein